MSNQKNNQENALANVSNVIDEQVANVMKTNFENFQSAFVMSTAIQQIDNALTADVMKPIMALQGKKMGFRTDKQYGVNVVKDAVIEGLLNGLQITGNQFNIIANNMYVTKEGFKHLLDQVPGLRYQIQHNIQGEKKGYADVISKITWKIGDAEGKKQTQVFPVKAGKYATPDSIFGKAERKARKWLYEQVTGSELDDGETTVDIDHAEVKNEIVKNRNANKKEVGFDEAKVDKETGEIKEPGQAATSAPDF